MESNELDNAGFGFVPLLGGNLIQPTIAMGKSAIRSADTPVAASTDARARSTTTVLD